jgi:uncharacterized protein YecE (DUF72 family)
VRRLLPSAASALRCSAIRARSIASRSTRRFIGRIGARRMSAGLEFDAGVVDQFLPALRHRWTGRVVCEPRHASWFSRAAERAIDVHSIGRAAADPAVVPSAAVPLSSKRELVYYRWHGSPKRYWSTYPSAMLERIAIEWLPYPASTDVWCIFDNTATGSALANALELQVRINACRPAAGTG